MAEMKSGSSSSGEGNSTPIPEVWGWAMSLLRLAFKEKRSVLINTAKILEDGSVDFQHERINLVDYDISILMVADLLHMIVAGTGVDQQTVLNDVARAFELFKGAEKK